MNYTKKHMKSKNVNTFLKYIEKFMEEIVVEIAAKDKKNNKINDLYAYWLNFSFEFHMIYYS